MNAEAIADVAAAGYREYHRGRLVRPFPALQGHETHRWLLVAARVLNGEALTAQAAREAYFDGFAEWPWATVTPKVQEQWRRTLRAMETTAQLLGGGPPNRPLVAPGW